jgi:hypothetical protein
MDADETIYSQSEAHHPMRFRKHEIVMKSDSNSWPRRWGVRLAAFGSVAVVASYAAGTPPTSPGGAATVVNPPAPVAASEARISSLEKTVAADGVKIAALETSVKQLAKQTCFMECKIKFPEPGPGTSSTALASVLLARKQCVVACGG